MDRCRYIYIYRAIFLLHYLVSFSLAIVLYVFRRADRALSGVRAMLTFVQKRPIGLGIKNNLGSLLLTSCSLSIFSLSSRLFNAPAPLIRRTLREVLLDIYSRTSCSWRSLSPNFPENWKNMLLNAFLLTYVWNFVILSSGRSRDPNLPLSLSLSYVLRAFPFSAGSYPRSSSAALCIIHPSQDSRHICDLVLSYVVLCRTL